MNYEWIMKDLSDYAVKWLSDYGVKILSGNECRVNFAEDFQCPWVDVAVVLNQFSFTRAEQKPCRRVVNRVVIDVGAVGDTSRYRAVC